MSEEIEVVDRYNVRHRFPSKGYYYEWRLKPGTLDIEGTEFLDVFFVHDNGDDMELVATFPNPAKVGIVTEDTALLLPEKQIEVCPRCGYREVT
jgi:hypothetical protein